MRKILITSAALTALQAVTPVGTTAETVKQREYIYSYDDEAQGLDDDVFLVCTDCPDSRLIPIHSIAARYSENPDRGEVVISAVEPPPLKVDSSASAVSRPEPRILGTIRFPFDSSFISTSSKRQLGQLDLGNKRVRLEGYTCTIGPEDYNEKLSQRRAKSLSKYLKAKGVTVLEAVGYGESTKFKNKAANRRVEIIDDAKE